MFQVLPIMMTVSAAAGMSSQTTGKSCWQCATTARGDGVQLVKPLTHKPSWRVVLDVARDTAEWYLCWHAIGCDDKLKSKEAIAKMVR